MSASNALLPELSIMQFMFCMILGFYFLHGGKYKSVAKASYDNYILLMMLTLIQPNRARRQVSLREGRLLLHIGPLLSTVARDCNVDVAHDQRFCGQL